MATYTARYKCRRCGETFSGDTCDRITALNVMAMLTIQESNVMAMLTIQESFEGSGIDVRRYEMHCCKNGEYGFADFIGFDREKRLVDDGNGAFHYEYVE